MNTEKLLKIVKKTLEDKKATNIRVLEVGRISSITDFMVVATGKTARQVIALAHYVREKAKSHKQPILGQEGTNTGEGEWALVDLGEVIVHVMQPETREFYQLEKLWSDMGKDGAQGYLA